MRFKTIAKTVALHASIFVLIVTGFTLVVNAPIFDQPLLPVLADRQSERQPLVYDDNAYVYLYGMDGDFSRDPMEAGRALVELLEQRADEGVEINFTEDERRAIVGGRDEAWQGRYPSLSCNSRTRFDCLASLVEEVRATPEPGAIIDRLLEQHRRLIAMGRFSEGRLGFSTPLPSYQYPLWAGRLSMAQAYLQGVDAFIDDADRQMDFWRLLVADGHTIIAKMIAAAGMRDVIYGMAVLIRDHELSPEQIERVTAVLRPLSGQDIDISESIWGEHDIVAGELSTLVDHGFRGLVGQVNATLNRYYEMQIRANLLLARLAPEHLPGPNHPDDSSIASGPNFFNPYNLSGRTFLSQMGGVRYDFYIARMHDVNGLLAVARALARAEGSDVELAQWIADAGLTSPYSDTPITVDADRDGVGFACYSDRDHCLLPF